MPEGSPVLQAAPLFLARRRVKPTKPYREFPLFPHATGRWAKKIHGKFVFFGPWEDPHGALERFMADRDLLYGARFARTAPSWRIQPHAGTPPVRPGAAAVPAPANRWGPAGSLSRSQLDSGPTVRDMINRFLTAKKRRLDSGEMGLRSFGEYHAACGLLVDHTGKDAPVLSLTSEDFGRLRAGLAKRLGPVALGNEVGRIRSVFKFAFESGLLDRPIRFGPEFVKPSRGTLRKARADTNPARFPGAFGACEVARSWRAWDDVGF